MPALNEALSFLLEPSISIGLGIGIAFLLYILWKNENRGLPPGPKGLPFVGYLPYLTRQHKLQDEFSRLIKKYGDVFSFRIPGGNLVIVFNTYETLREAFVKQGDNVAALPKTFTFIKWVLKNSGLEGQNDLAVWREHRRFMMHSLRDFGYGKSILEQDIRECTEDLIKQFNQNINKPYSVVPYLSNCVGNVMYKLFLNKKFSLEDESFKTLFIGSLEILGSMPGLETARPFAVVGKYIPMEFIPKYRNLCKRRDQLYDLLEKVIREHEETFDPNNLRDFVDVYLNKMQNAEPGSQEAILFDRKHLAPLCLNMLIGATSTTSDVTTWAIKLLCMYPDVQRKVQREIDEVIGREKWPSYADNVKTPYTSATMHEVMRIASVFPISEFLRVIEDTKIAGYRVPKDTLLLGNMYNCHRDPKAWKYPDEFNPDNFLGADGKLKKDSFVTFFLGKRVCPGEIVARMHFYILLVALLQRFDFRLADGEPRTLSTNIGMGRTLSFFNVVITPRK